MPARAYLPTFPHLLANPGRPVIHRDLSGFQFNERVLAQARSPSNPLLERLKFLGITASNMDEFFMIRYASLDRSIRQAAGAGRRHMAHVRNALLDAVGPFCAKQGETLDILASALQARGVQIVLNPSSGEKAFALGRCLFEEAVLPKLPPPRPFKFGALGGLLNTQIGAIFPEGLWFPVPLVLPPAFQVVDDGRAYIFLLDQLLIAHLGAAHRLDKAPGLLRLTRDGDIPADLAENDTAAIPDIIRKGLSSRDRGRPVRLQYSGDMPLDVLNRCLSALHLSPRQVFQAPASLCLHGFQRAANDLPAPLREARDMAHPPLRGFLPGPFLQGRKIFDVLKERDLLLHHPYDSFDAYVNWITAACEDPDVTLIQQTLYRTDALSPVMGALKAAAKRKKVRVVVELRARFDELNNLRIADELRKAGAEVSFGFGRIKVHGKLALAVRREGKEQRTYVHLATGNYNAATARQYEDLAVLTAHPEIGTDARAFFDAVFRGEAPSALRQLVPAPARLHRLLLGLIERETAAARAGRPARIAAKVNALVDDRIVEKLYEASRAGVAVDLMVRGACALIPGVRGLSDNVRVISLVDRFLEHSRIYFFESSNRMYLSSADWMPRNFFSRLEIAFPVLDPRIAGYIKDVVLPAYFADTVKGRELTPQGLWKKRSLACTRSPRFQKASPLFVGKSLRAQTFFIELAERGYQGTPLSRAANHPVA